MSFWGDFKEKLTQEYNKNTDLKKSVENIKDKAEDIGQKSSKITSKVSSKIKDSVPIMPESETVKKGAGKASEILKKTLDFMGRLIPFGETESPAQQKSQQTATANPDAKTAKTATTTETKDTTRTTTDNATSQSAKEPDVKAGPAIKKTEKKETQASVPPLENPEEAPGGGTALTVRPTSEWETYW